jgi:hypothetical protein
MSIVFMSSYCKANCNGPRNPENAPLAPTIIDPPRNYHDLPIVGEPVQIHHSKYQPPSVEDATEDATEHSDKNEEPPIHTSQLHLPISEELTAGRKSYRTYAADIEGQPEHRGEMIPNRPRYQPEKTARIRERRLKGRRSKKTPPKRPSGVPHRPIQPYSNETEQEEELDLADIRMLNTTGFLQFCKSPGVRAMKLSWDELDSAAPSKNQPHQPPDLPDRTHEATLKGEGDRTGIRKEFPVAMSDFIDECNNLYHLNKVSDLDIKNFMTPKPELSEEDVK